MVKNKQKRSMIMITKSQKMAEQAVAKKFSSAETILKKTAPSKKPAVLANGRINPQVSCTVSPEDKELLKKLTLYACNREKKVLNTSAIIRSLIRLGNKHKNELVF